MTKHLLLCGTFAFSQILFSAAVAEAPPELTALWDSVEALASDRSFSGRVSKNELVHWKDATDSTGKIKFSNYHGNPKTRQEGTEGSPLRFTDIDFRDTTLFVDHAHLIFENCIFDATREPDSKPGYWWVRFAEGVKSISFVNCEFTGKNGGDGINGGLISLGKPLPGDYPENYTRVCDLLVERCRFQYSTSDYVKPSFGPGTVFRHNYFGYGWMFDPEIIPWTKETGGVGILRGDLVIYRSAKSRAKVDYPETMPPSKRGQPDTDEWENLGDIPHFDYLQDGDGGPVLWEGNLFEIGLQDIPQIQLVNNVVRFARDFGTNRPIAGQRFIGNVFRLRENYAGPLYPIVINHKAGEDQSLEDVNVFGHMEFSYNLLVPKKKYKSVMQLAGKAEENLIFAENYLTGDRSRIPAPAKSIATTKSSIPSPLPTKAVVRVPKILFNARMLWKVNKDGTRSYRSLPPIYEHRADSVQAVATLNGVNVEDFDDSVLHTYPVNTDFSVTYVLRNQAGSVEAEAVPVPKQSTRFPAPQ